MQLLLTDSPAIALQIAQSLNLKPAGQHKYLPPRQGEGSTTEPRSDKSHSQQNPTFLSADWAVVCCGSWISEPAPPQAYLPINLDQPQESEGQLTLPNGTESGYVWKLDQLPIIPSPWRRKLKSHANDILQQVSQLLTECTHVIHAGRPNRDSQALLDDILQHAKNDKPVSRLWLNSLDPSQIKKAFKQLQPNESFAPLRESAVARIHADWLFQTNITRALALATVSALPIQTTSHASENAVPDGLFNALTVGRLQAVILALVVNRDIEFEGYKSSSLHSLSTTLKFKNQQFTASLGLSNNPTENPSDTEYAQAIDNLAQPHTANAQPVIDTEHYKDQWATVSSLVSRKMLYRPPAPATLSRLVEYCSSKHGYTAHSVTEALISLFEQHQLISYPLTESPYLPERMRSRSGTTLAKLKRYHPNLKSIIDLADTRRQSRCWKETGANHHHAIAPSDHLPESPALSTAEATLYTLVVKLYVAQFLSTSEYLFTDIGFTVRDQLLQTTQIELIKPGWQECPELQPLATEPPALTLANQIASLDIGENGTCIDAYVKSEQTVPISRFSEGSLIRAMADFSRLENLRNFKLETITPSIGDGKTLQRLATPLTRSLLLEDLKRKGYLELQGRKIVSTPLGRQLISKLPDSLTKIDFALACERDLSEIAQGRGDYHRFMKNQAAHIEDQIQTIKDKPPSVALFQSNADGNITPDLPANTNTNTNTNTNYQCKKCGLALIKHTAKNGNGYWFGCSGFPSCRANYDEQLGQPVLRESNAELTTFNCDECGEPLLKRLSKSTKARKQGKAKKASAGKKSNKTQKTSQDNDYWFGCSAYPSCKKTYSCVNGKPTAHTVHTKGTNSGHMCSLCARPLQRLKAKRKGQYFWGCTGYPLHCKATYKDLGGAPEF